jgi:lysozyme
MNLSEAGLDFIKSFEKFRSKVYPDEGGKPTIGYGHLVRPGEIWPPDGIDTTRALLVLKGDVGDAERCITTCTRVSVGQKEFDALVSLCFNIGCGNFRDSTLLRYLNHADFDDAAKQFLVWNKDGGHVSTGLSDRRQKEQQIFLKGVYENHI